MRILMATDLHGSRRALVTIPAAVREHRADLFLAVGDITHFGQPAGYAGDLIARVPVPTLAVPGNCDPPFVMDALEGLGVNLHMRRTRVEGQTLVGLGGANPTPFGTPFEIEEDEIWRGLDAVMEPGAVLVSHPPPYGHLDVVRTGEHVGSTAVLRIVEKYRPRAVLTGHIHESPGIEVGNVVMINPGPAKDGHLGLVDIAETVTARIL
ncbi:MAG TPA: metallophosphoesterase [Thermoplasmata archaeon]|nr:metallophosphoesterase [Thermoplasmata archaeon]